MSKRWFYNFLAACLVVLYCIVLLLVAGCGTVHIESTPDGGFVWDSKTLFKDVEKVTGIQTPDGGINFSLGRSGGSMSDAQTQALMCVLNPGACK